MENKINIAELLKDCPKGMELDCTIFDDVYFDYIDDVSDIINCYIQDSTKKIGISFSKYGCYSSISKSKCVIFPKGKTTWKGFNKFKDGDVVVTTLDNLAIIKERSINGEYRTHCLLLNDITTRIRVCPKRLATEEEKQKLFQAIKDNGYNWNAETKTLEKLVEPKFKVGDMIQDVDKYKVKITEVNIEDECYGYESIIVKGIGGIAFSEQDNWELVPDKFDITTLKPFESRVLTRDNNSQKWFPAIWGYYDFDSHGYPHKLIGGVATRYCIPYESNEHLLGTTDDCDEYYKTREEL